jgi:hypothetical protein
VASNKGKTDQIHELLPKHLGSRQNTNWKALAEALGQSDQQTADLVAEVRKQFFVKTASRPYLDRLAANSKIARPRLVGMDDPSFRQYIPVLSYQPKQVKLIIDQLLDIFFFKESTTAFITSDNFSPFSLKDTWELDILVDEQYRERITFKTSDFTDISAASADEIVSAINRQAKYCYATSYYDSITQNTFIRMFTNTVGSKGSLRILGGRANVALRFDGFISTAGNGSSTEWTVTKVGDEVTFQNTGGANAGVDQLKTGDIAIIDIPGNKGSFEIIDVDLVNSSIKFKNLFGTPGVFTQTSADDTKFIENKKFVAYLNPRRAMTWETSPGEITVEMPTSPPVVKRSLQGSIHVNGTFSQMTNRDSDTSLTVSDAFAFPESGSFYLEQVNEIVTRILTTSENQIISKKQNTRLQSSLQKYEYSSRVALSTTGDIVAGIAQITNLSSTVGLSIGQQVKMDGVPAYARVTSISGNIANISVEATTTATAQSVKFLGNQLVGITPNLPEAANLNEFTLTSLTRSSNVVTGVTALPHGYKVGESVIISNTSGGPGNWNGSFIITSVSSNTFTYNQIDASGSASTLGQARVERIAMSNSGSKVILTDAISNKVSRITGSYIWDQAATFVLSSNTGDSLEAVQAGKIVRLLNIGSNTLPDSGGFVIFNYGRSNQEGPIRYLYKPTPNTLAIDPSYTFKNSHAIGSPIVAISKKGPHQMSGKALEYPAYITDPSEARIILQELIRSVKSAGIFVNFLIRFPEQLYATLDVYNSGNDPG